MTEIDEEEHSAAVSETAGSVLKSAREAAGMTLVQAAEKLHLLKATVVALEDDDVSQLPSRVFTLGYLKNYARIVDVPETRIMELVREEVEEVEEVRNLKQPYTPRIRTRKRKQKNGGRLFVKVITWLFLIAITALLALWWRGAIQLPDLSGLPFLSTTEKQKSVEATVDDGSETLTLAIGDGAVPQQKIETSPDATVVREQPLKESIDENHIEFSLDTDNAAATPGVEEGGQGNSDDIKKQSVTDAKAEAAVESGETDAAAIAAVEESQASSGEKITLDFADNCWVNVNDADGDIVLFGDMPAGASKLLEGKAPFTIVLGNAVKVKISVDGRPYDIAPHIKGGVARFSLGNPGQ